MTFEITVLGSSGSYASVDNPCTGYLVRSPGACVLLDCGPGTLGPLQREISLHDLDAVVLTHCHPDHWLELPVLRNVFTWFVPRREVPLYGTAQTRAMDHAVSVIADGQVDPFLWDTIDGSSSRVIGDQDWRFSVTDHPVETLAARVEAEGRSFVFSSDTGPGWQLSALGPAPDLALCDASHLSEWEGQGIPHLSAREAGERAQSAGVGQLVITHLMPGSDPAAHQAEAEAAFGAAVAVAQPGARFTV